MKLQLVKASTDVSIYVLIQDSSSAIGAGLTGLAYDTASLVFYYVRPLGSASQLVLVTQTVGGAHTDGGFVEVSSANMPGVYRVDLSDAICATGVGSVFGMFKGAADMAPLPLEIQLTDFDMNTATVAIGSGGIQTTSFAAGAIDAAAIAADAIGSSEFAQSAAQEVADEVLNRDLVGGSSGNTRNVRNALRILRNRGAIAGGTLTVYEEDDSSPAWTATVSTAAGNPISEVNPA